MLRACRRCTTEDASLPLDGAMLRRRCGPRLPSTAARIDENCPFGSPCFLTSHMCPLRAVWNVKKYGVPVDDINKLSNAMFFFLNITSNFCNTWSHPALCFEDGHIWPPTSNHVGHCTREVVIYDNYEINWANTICERTWIITCVEFEPSGKNRRREIRRYSYDFKIVYFRFLRDTAVAIRTPLEKLRQSTD